MHFEGDRHVESICDDSGNSQDTAYHKHLLISDISDYYNLSSFDLIFIEIKFNRPARLGHIWGKCKGDFSCKTL